MTIETVEWTETTIRRITDLKEQDAGPHFYWQSRTTAESLEAIAEQVRDG